MSWSVDTPVGPDLPDPSPAARLIFGGRLDGAVRYGELLASIGTAHGHIGPREVPRLWDRHLANCAVVTDLVPIGARVVDIGSGAGLPGIPMALRRKDLAVTLVDPMLRRTVFLSEAVDLLGLKDRVHVVRGRADDSVVANDLPPAAWVTARAVAPLDRLVRWCLPLLAPGGKLLALKGSTAADEAAQLRPGLTMPGGAEVAGIEVIELGAQYEMEPTHVIVVERGERPTTRRRRVT